MLAFVKEKKIPFCYSLNVFVPPPPYLLQIHRFQIRVVIRMEPS